MMSQALSVENLKYSILERYNTELTYAPQFNDGSKHLKHAGNEIARRRLPAPRGNRGGPSEKEGKILVRAISISSDSLPEKFGPQREARRRLSVYKVKLGQMIVTLHHSTSMGEIFTVCLASTRSEAPS